VGDDREWNRLESSSRVSCGLHHHPISHRRAGRSFPPSEVGFSSTGPVPLRDWGLKRRGCKSHYAGPALLGLSTIDYTSFNSVLTQSTSAVGGCRQQPAGRHGEADEAVPHGHPNVLPQGPCAHSTQSPTPRSDAIRLLVAQQQVAESRESGTARRCSKGTEAACGAARPGEGFS
jgi:hypothetical protein